jgi:hypothetical protein
MGMGFRSGRHRRAGPLHEEAVAHGHVDHHDGHGDHHADRHHDSPEALGPVFGPAPDHAGLTRTSSKARWSNALASCLALADTVPTRTTAFPRFSTSPRPRAGRITAAMLIGYAVTGMVTGVIFPMNTREVLAAGEGTLRNAMHPPGTIVMSLFIVLAMVFGSTLLGKRFRYYSYGTILTLIVFGVLTSLQVGQMEANQPTPWMGVEERINIYATMLWVAVLAIGLLRAQKAR